MYLVYLESVLLRWRMIETIIFVSLFALVVVIMPVFIAYIVIFKLL
jgi:hypothetical protein